MGLLVRLASKLSRLRSSAIELMGLLLIAVGFEHIYPPAAFIFAGAAMVFIAQGAERDE